MQASGTNTATRRHGRRDFLKSAGAALAAGALGVPAVRGKWFHIKALVKGCYFEATADDLAGRSQARLTYFDQDCSKRSGAVGVRTYGLLASWRNFTVTQAE